MVKKRRVPRLVVCMSLIVALAVSALTITAVATYENTHANTGDGALDIVSVAQTQVGYSEGSNSYTKYGDWYGLPNSDWCAMFVSWCADQAGIDQSTFQKFALCSSGCDYFMSLGEFNYSGSYTPQAGDLIFYASYGSIYHVGLVVSSDSTNVYSIEGNYSDRVSEVTHSLSYGDILGYATPNYSSASSADTAVEDEEEETVPSENADTSSEDDDYLYVDEYDYYESASSDEEEDADNSEVEEEKSDTQTDEGTDEIDSDDTQETADTDTDDNSDISAQTDEEYVQGDVNGDGKVDTLDVLMVQRYLVELEEFSDAQVAAADINGTGAVELSDSIAILNIISAAA